MPDLVVGTLRLAAPLAAVALAAGLYYRIGVINIALDGQIQAAAISYVLITTLVGWAFGGFLVAILAATLTGALLVHIVIRWKANDLLVGFGLLYVGTAGATVLSAGTFGNPYAPLPAERLGVAPVTLMLWVAVVVVVLSEQNIRAFRVSKVIKEAPELARLQGIHTEKWAHIHNLIGAILIALSAVLLVEFGRGFGSGTSGERGFLALAIIAVAQHSPVRTIGLVLMFALGQKAVLGTPLNIGGIVVPSELWEFLLYFLAISILVAHGLRSRGELRAADRTAIEVSPIQVDGVVPK